MTYSRVVRRLIHQPPFLSLNTTNKTASNRIGDLDGADNDSTTQSFRRDPSVQVCAVQTHCLLTIKNLLPAHLVLTKSALP